MGKRGLRIAGGGSGDSAVLDALAAKAKERGFDAIGLATLAEHTQDQIGDGKDFWVRFTAGCPGIMKVVETSLVHDVISKEHIEKNARLLAEQSRVVEKRGLRGVVGFLEPMWLPGWWYREHPDLRGARCDNPCLALKRYYAPCVDHPKVLAHYREATRRLLELAPAISVITLSPNDSGSGICWTSGLYPGPNGNPACKDRNFGERIAGWLKAVYEGAADAGREIIVVLSPVHFSRGEKHETIKQLPPKTYLSVGRDNFPNIPFFSREALDTIEKTREAGRGVFLSVSPTLVGWLMEPATEMPVPYFMFDAWREAGKVDAEVLAVGGLGAPIMGEETAPTLVTLSAMEKTPKDGADIDNRVAAIAERLVGAALAPALLSAWRDVDHAVRIWPNNADTNHMLYPKYSVIGDRWLVRPLVPAPQLLTEDEKAHYSRHRHVGRGLTKEQLDSFFISESRPNYQVAEYKWLVAAYDEMMDYMDRAVKTLEDAMPKAPKSEAEKRFRLQWLRVKAARAIWRNQRNVLRCGSTIEFFTGEKKEEYWHVIRRDESFLEPATYRRLFLEAVDDEIANCREIIALLGEKDAALFSTGDEQSFVLPRNLGEHLEKKIRTMEAHKKDIDVLFPNCPPETYADPTYEWADRTTEDG